MARDLQILLDPQPRGFYTAKDTVSGKVILENATPETIASIYIFFRGCINIEFEPREDDEPNEPPMYKYEDQDVMFQTYQKLFDGDEKLLPKTRYSWPFTFEFRDPNDANPKPLPPSGKFGRSSVEYKVLAVPRHVGQAEEKIMEMMKPQDPALPRKTLVYSVFRVYANLMKKKVCGVVEEKLQYVQPKSQTLDTSMQGPFSRAFEVESRYLPQLGSMPGNSSKATQRNLGEESTNIPFSIKIQYPRMLAEGVQFPVLLWVASPSKLWQVNSPRVTLNSLSASVHGNNIQRSAGVDHREGKIYFSTNKRPRISLTSEAVDIGTMYDFRLAGDGLLPSFGTRLLERSYTFRMNLEFDVGGKAFKFLHYGSVKV
jgi:hypothetical protein